MSSFIAVIHFDSTPVYHNLVTHLTGLLACHSLDEKHVVINESAGFGHVLVRSTYFCDHDNQPLVDQSLILVADARIDDRANLLSELQSSGFKVNCNVPASELILAAYKAWGDRVVEHLIGDFAFVLWDGTKKTLFAARDHFGKRTVYFSKIKNGFIFSNEILPIQSHPDVSSCLDDRAIGNFLLFGDHCRTDQRLTPFADIHSLAPAEKITLTDHSLAIDKYWHLPLSGSVLKYKNEKEYLIHCREIVKKAVNDRTQTPKLVVALSGGLDSGTVAALCVELIREGKGPKKIAAYTAASSLSDQEYIYAEKVASYLEIEHHLFNTEKFKLLKPWVPSLIPLTALSPSHGLAGATLAASLGRVLITGASSDNLLHPWSTTLIAQLQTAGIYQTLKALKILQNEFSHRPPLGVRSKFKPTKLTDLKSGYPYPKWLNQDFESQQGLRHLWQSFWADSAQKPVSQRSSLSQTLNQSWHIHRALPKPNFNPVENVDPFLDLRVIDFFASLPPLPWLYRKYILRAMMRDMIPDEVLRRPKTPAGDLASKHLENLNNGWMDKWRPHPQLNCYIERSLVPTLSSGSNQSSHPIVDFRPLMLNLWLHSLPQAVKFTN